MLAHQLTSALLLATAFTINFNSVDGFDADKSDVFVFRTQENALWHCGARLPAPKDNEWTALYCEHSQGDYLLPNGQWPFAWASNHPNDWCDFMVSTVRQTNEDHYPLTPEISINETP